jgi:c-di-GMP-binding flagellar brake protein YcgR
MDPSTERRGAERAQIAVTCSLRRRTGSPVPARTLDLGAGGMRVATARPLAIDETLRFELHAAGQQALTGDARVLRQQGYAIYGLRFEGLPDSARERLSALARNARTADT